MVFLPEPTDPFYELMRPPPDETPAQKAARQKREIEAKRVNDTIDADIERERTLAARPGKQVTKILLLGHAESGKTTILKNLRMKYAPDEWKKERISWRSVVQLNVVSSILTILSVIEAASSGEAPVNSDEGKVSEEDMGFTDRHQSLLHRLAPLHSVEAELKHRIGAGASPLRPGTDPMSATPSERPEVSRNAQRRPESSVRSWNDVLVAENRVGDASSMVDDSVTATLADCKCDMIDLWSDRAVKLALRRRRIQLNDSAGFFLDDLDRIASRDYDVTDDDVLRARLRTVGVQEHVIFCESHPWDNKLIWEWRIFDVGGCRTLRTAWLPFFDNINVIICVSPVSVFDESLEEDPAINRLEDSMNLWTSICSSRLLAEAHLILFLNKCDLLERKLKRGIQLKHFVSSFGDRPNDLESVVKYLHSKFQALQRQNSPQRRLCHIYHTAGVADTSTMCAILTTLRDAVLRDSLANSSLL